MRRLPKLLLLCLVSQTCWADTPPIPPLPLVVPTPNETYLVYSDPNPLSDHYFPAFKAIAAAIALDRNGVSGPGNPRGYHEGYMNLGFRYPYFSDQPKSVYYYDCKEPTDDPAVTCDNGMAPVANILMPVSVYAGKSDSCIRGIQGHELFHHVEFAYANAIGRSGCGSIWGNAACEGQARALQDKIYLDLDLDPSASCVATFLGQVNGYLKNTNQYLWASSYDSALFWTYLMEQFGQNPFEPGRGADFITTWWDNAEAAGSGGADAVAITNDTIADYDPTRNIYTEFRAFAMANLIKDFDLSAASASFVDRYSYRDEDPVLFFNQMNFNDVTVDLNIDLDGGGEITQLMGAQYFGARYLKVDVQDCAPNRIMRLKINAADTTTAGVDNIAGYGVVIVRNNRPVSYYKKFAVDWTLTTFQTNPRRDAIYLVVAPIAGFWLANVSASCDAPETTFDLDFPLLGPTHPGQGGPPSAQGVFQVDVVPGIDRLRPSIGGLTSSDFLASVGGQPATVLDAVRTLDRYRLSLRLPVQSAPGRYNLDVQLGGSTFQLPNAIVHGDYEADVMIAIDTSTSMLLPPDGSRLDAVRSAGQFFVESLPEAKRMGLIRYAGDNFEPNTDAQLIVPLAIADSVIRNRIRTGIGNLTSGPNRLTSIGDALLLGMNQLNTGGGADSERHLVLLSDGSENEGLFYSDVRDALIASAIRVHTIALGPLSDQGLLARIARDTGGEYRYAAVEPLATDVLDVHAAFGQIAGVIAKRQILNEASGMLPAGQTLVIEQPVGPIPLLVPAVQSARAAAERANRNAGSPLIAALHVFRPDGSEVVDGQGGARIVNGGDWYTIEVPQLMPGRWRYEITAGVEDIEFDLDMTALTPDRKLLASVGPEDDGDHPPTAVNAGDRYRLHASLVSPEAGAAISTEIRSCDGSVRKLAVATGTADGFDDLVPGAGPGALPMNVSLAVAAGPGSPTGFPDDLTQPGQCGSYRVRVVAEFPDATSLIAHEVIHVLQQQGTLDIDGDTLPDAYENRLACLDASLPDATLDQDGDGVPTRFEFEEGSNPCNPDSDGGGETDGSERRAGRGVLDARDDRLRRPVDVYPITRLSEHETEQPLASNAISLRPPRLNEYASLVLLRGTDPAALTPIATLLPTNIGARYVDTMNLVPGQTYYYQWRGFDADGNEGSPSHVFPMRAMTDNEAPIGAVELNGGRPRTDDVNLQQMTSLYNEMPATTQMQVKTFICPAEDVPGATTVSVLPYAEVGSVPAPSVGSVCTYGVNVVLIDANGNESPGYADDIELWPRGSLGDIRGTLFVPDGTPLRAVVEIDNDPTQAPALANDLGFYILPDLKTGTYDLRISLYNHQTIVVEDVQVVAGQITEVPPITLQPDTDRIFANGFE